MKRKTVADGGGGWIRNERRRAIYLRDRERCVYCNRGRKGDGVELTIDHVNPLAGNKFWNLVTACKRCNSVKQAKSLEHFLHALAKEGIDISETKKRLERVTGRR